MKHRRLCAFLAIEAILYIFILTAGGTLLVATSYAAIVLCFVYALLGGKQGEPLLVGGLAMTVAADFCLVVCSPIQQLWGMLFFLVAQTLYAGCLQRGNKRWLLWLRLVLIAVAEAVTVLVLRENTDALAVVSLGYYANLVMNIVAAFAAGKPHWRLAIALTLFLLCDTVIGLQVAAGGYLPIAEGSLLHRIIFMPFNLSWLFYLPSQVLIAIEAKKKTSVH